MPITIESNRIEGILKDSPPKASPMHCSPIQTPNRGTRGPSSKTVCNDIPESWGAPIQVQVKCSFEADNMFPRITYQHKFLPGPGDMSTPLGFLLQKHQKRVNKQLDYLFNSSTLRTREDNILTTKLWSLTFLIPPQ